MVIYINNVSTNNFLIFWGHPAHEQAEAAMLERERERETRENDRMRQAVLEEYRSEQADIRRMYEAAQFRQPK